MYTNPQWYMADVRVRITNALSARYAVQREVGAGAMGVVYEALDLRHQRTVAIKVLPPEVAAALGSERFLREIALTARLDHPHILPLLDSGNADGLLYYVMPYVDGESLRERLDRESPLPIDEAIRIVRQVADALDHAHRQGIVHRDIKPDNIMVGAGHARIADFGIARVIAMAGDAPHVTKGLVLGTPGYMSPEQGAGNRPIDGRSDIYSLACVLFELLTAEPPFPGTTAQAILVRQISQEPPSAAALRSRVPIGVDTAIRRALAQHPADRFRTAAEFAEALARPDEMNRLPRSRWRRVAMAGAAAMILGASGLMWFVLGLSTSNASTVDGAVDFNRLAVLYFDDTSPTGSLGWLARELTEDLIDALTEVQGFTVISRNGVRPFIDSMVSTDSIGRQLGVGVLIDGKVEPSDSTATHVRVTVRLIEASTGVALDRQALTRPLREPLALRRELTQDVEHLLRKLIGRHVRLREERSAAINDASWENYARARQAREDGTTLLYGGDARAAARRWAQADSMLQLAEQRGRGWNQPIIERAELALTRAIAAQTPADTMLFGGSLGTLLSQGLAHTHRVLERTRDDPSAYVVRGEIMLRMAQFDKSVESDALLSDALNALNRATELDPRLARAHYLISDVLERLNRPQESHLAARRAVEVDIYAERAPQILSRLFLDALRRDATAEADTLCSLAAHHYPTEPNARQCRLLFLGWTANGATAVQQGWSLVNELDSVAELTGFRLQRRLLVAAMLARTAGMQDSARKVLAATSALATGDTEVAIALDVAHVALLLGERDRALQVLSDGVRRDATLAADIDGHRWLRPLADDARFRRIVARPR